MEKRRRGGVSSSSVLVLAVLLATAAMPPPRVAAGLSPDYYKDSCPDLESIVRYEVTRKKNETVVTIPATLRLVFHDCMAGGGAAVLIASKNNDAQKDAPDNESLAGDGFDTINRVKAAVEKKCPGVVSCADIIALAARDVVYLADGPEWPVELGRLDALTSRASDVKGKLPDPDMDVNGLMQVFQRKGFSKVDMVALSGAHTVGFAHCSRFTNRLYGYGGGGGGGGSGTDPSFNPDYADQLKEACPVNVGATIAVNMDPVSPVKFDNTYYINLQNRLGLFASDQVLYTDETTRPIVDKFAASQKEFFDAFVAAMLKLGRIGVKTGKEGEIRRVCTAFNH